MFDELFADHPLPWSRGSSTSDGELVYDANREIVIVVHTVHGEHCEQLQKLIVKAANNCRVQEP